MKYRSGMFIMDKSDNCDKCMDKQNCEELKRIQKRVRILGEVGIVSCARKKKIMCDMYDDLEELLNYGRFRAVDEIKLEDYDFVCEDEEAKERAQKRTEALENIFGCLKDLSSEQLKLFNESTEGE